MTAKILIELEGVEAGSKECGGCLHLSDYPIDPPFVYPVCSNDALPHGGGKELLRGRHGCLRCPECLEAEVKVPDHPTLAGLGSEFPRKKS